MNVYYSNPFSIEKNFGKAINDFVSLVPSGNDWVVIQDGDIIYLTPDWGKRIHDALTLDGDKFGLVGCYTSRLRGLHQLHERKISNNHNMVCHYDIAKTYNEPGIQDIGNLGIAGFFMAFKKSTWERAGGFKENTYVFDTEFNRSVRALGMRLGLIRSLYVYHSYRIWANHDPANNYQHLR